MAVIPRPPYSICPDHGQSHSHKHHLTKTRATIYQSINLSIDLSAYLSSGPSVRPSIIHRLRLCLCLCLSQCQTPHRRRATFLAPRPRSRNTVHEHVSPVPVLRCAVSGHLSRELRRVTGQPTPFLLCSLFAISSVLPGLCPGSAPSLPFSHLSSSPQASILLPPQCRVQVTCMTFGPLKSFIRSWLVSTVCDCFSHSLLPPHSVESRLPTSAFH